MGNRSTALCSYPMCLQRWVMTRTNVEPACRGRSGRESGADNSLANDQHLDLIINITYNSFFIVLVEKPYFRHAALFPALMIGKGR